MNKSTKAFILGVGVGLAAYHLYASGLSTPGQQQ